MYLQNHLLIPLRTYFCELSLISSGSAPCCVRSPTLTNRKEGVGNELDSLEKMRGGKVTEEQRGKSIFVYKGSGKN